MGEEGKYAVCPFWGVDLGASCFALSLFAVQYLMVMELVRLKSHACAGILEGAMEKVRKRDQR